MNTCINCQTEVTSAYCPTCGQKNPIKKINAVNLWSDFLSRVYGFDGMFPRTLVDLTIRPGHAAREYIRGNRVKYYGPLGYFFLMITIYLLLASLIGVDLAEYSQASSPTPPPTGRGQLELSLQFTHWMIDNLRLVTFTIAIFSVFFTWLYFRKSGYNLIESSVLIFYFNGHLMWISMIAIILYRFAGWAINFNYFMMMTIGFMLFAYVNFYTYQSKWKVLLKGMLSYLSAYLLMLILAGLFVVYLIKNDREFYEKVRPKNNLPAVEQSPSK